MSQSLKINADTIGYTEIVMMEKLLGVNNPSLTMEELEDISNGLDLMIGQDIKEKSIYLLTNLKVESQLDNYKK